MLKSPFYFLSSVESETPTGVWSWAKRLIETLQKWRLTDLIDQPLMGSEGKYIRIKDDASGYEHAGGSTTISTGVGYTEETINGDVVIVGTGPISITLPTAVGNSANFYVRAVGDVVTMFPSGAETINGAASLAIAAGAAAHLRSNNISWWTF